MEPLSIGACATLACLLEATAPKVGNVHRAADFEDLTFTDFAVSSVAIGPIVERAAEQGIGRTVRDGVAATRTLVQTNTNLGILLLIAPLASVPRATGLKQGIAAALAACSAHDAAFVYEAIRLAQPGGLGQVETMDVRDTAPPDLRIAMQAAADRDLIARQYVNDFADVLDRVVPWLVETRQSGVSLTDSIIHTQMLLLSSEPDSLIARKCGFEVAREASRFASIVLDTGPPGTDEYVAALGDFDFWLRSDGHRRNPGTTADLIAAGLFAALRDNRLPPPWR